MKNLYRPQHGQALVLIVLAIVGIIGIVALAIDGGNAFSDRRHAQMAADAAAIAGALEKVSGRDWRYAAIALAISNGYYNDGTYSVVTVNSPPLAEDCSPDDVPNPYVGNENYVQVIIHSTINTFFAPVIGIDQLSSCVESDALAMPAHTAPMFSGSALVSLNPHDCSAFKVHGTSDTTLTGSGAFVNSDSECIQGAFDQNGDGGLIAPSLCVVGSARYDPGKAPTPTACDPVPYPPELVYPAPVCTDNATRSGAIITPGSMPASWISKDVTLLPGIYCISGSVTINAGDAVFGDGVLLYFIDGGIHMNGNAQVNLSAPTTGLYAGLLIYLPLENDSSVILNGNSDSTFIGSVLAPASDIQINGTSNNDTYHTQIIGYTIDLIGTSNSAINYADDQNYDATIPPSLELSR